MGIGIGSETISLQSIQNKVSEFDILNFYFGISSLPTLINSPLRKDTHPSFSIYVTNENKVRFKDYSTGQNGGIIDLLSLMWGTSFIDTIHKINKEVVGQVNCSITINNTSYKHRYNKEDSILECVVRNWEQHDIDFWKSFGITVEWLNYADVYPIKLKIVKKDGRIYTFSADKFAYAYVERKEGVVTLKIYQPYNTQGFKWSNKHDSSVISLWTKIPKKGDSLCICSSLKDALCLWVNTGIPAVAIQGEGYGISSTAISQLKTRFNNIYILFDNDVAGITNSQKLAISTGFINVTDRFVSINAKDISDYYKTCTKEEFKKTMLNILKIK